MAIKTDFDVYYIPVSHQPFGNFTPQNFIVPSDFFLDIKVPIIAHNMKFDYQVLERAGIKLPVGNLKCTMMMSVYINENHNPGHDLDTVLKVYLGKSKKKVEQKALVGFGWEKSPPSLMEQYACQDVVELPELYQVLLSKSEDKWLKLWQEVDLPFMLLLVKMENQGILIDRDLCSQLEAKCSFRMDEIRQELQFDPAKPSQLHPKLFDEPPYGLGLQISSLTPGGKPKVSLDWLQSQGHPVTALVYEYRKTAKQQSSYFSAYLNATTRDYPRLHPNFKQHGTETGRLSCENPNLQQIPREDYKDANVKKLFLPETHRQLWEVDYRTIEYRLQAVYANSEQLIDLFENEGDFHQLVADDVSRQAGINVSRQQAKTINYLMSFGGGKPVLQKQLKVDFKVAERIWEGYRRAYPEIFEKAEEANSIADEGMEIDMWSGRTRHFTWPTETHKAFNAVIQGGAFEIVKRSMLKLDEAGFNQCNQVHDSVWFNVDSEKDVIEAQHVMEDWTKDFFGLSFRTDRKRLN